MRERYRRQLPSKKASPAVLLSIARIMTLASKITGKPPALKPNIVMRLNASFEYNSDRAKCELGLRFRPLSQTLTDTANWLLKKADAG